MFSFLSLSTLGAPDPSTGHRTSRLSCYCKLQKKKHCAAVTTVIWVLVCVNDYQTETSDRTGPGVRLLAWRISFLGLVLFKLFPCVVSISIHLPLSLFSKFRRNSFWLLASVKEFEFECLFRSLRGARKDTVILHASHFVLRSG